MATRQVSQPDAIAAEFRPPMSARRLYVIGGIALIAVGMIFGDIFAVFVLHQNAGRIGENLLAATEAVADGDQAAVLARFQNIGRLLENRGTKVDTHVHIIDFGYLAILLALAQPYLLLDERRKKQLATLFLSGAVLLPVGVFLIYYVGLAYSPLSSIGWASIAADFGGLLVIVAVAWSLVGFWRYLRQPAAAESNALLADQSWPGRVLLSGGTLLILAGFLHGAFYAGVFLYEHEHREVSLLRSMAELAASQSMAEATQTVNDYGMLQAEKAVALAAHSHIIEFGLLAMMVALIQPYVMLQEKWRRRWAVTLLAGGVILPVFVQAELWWGLVAGGIADLGGLLVIVALSGMLVGVFRYTGRLDAGKGAA